MRASSFVQNLWVWSRVEAEAFTEDDLEKTDALLPHVEKRIRMCVAQHVEGANRSEHPLSTATSCPQSFSSLARNASCCSALATQAIDWRSVCMEIVRTYAKDQDQQAAHSFLMVAKQPCQ